MIYNKHLSKTQYLFIERWKKFQEMVQTAQENKVTNYKIVITCTHFAK